MRRVLMILAVTGLLAGCASEPFHVPQAPMGKECTPVKEARGEAGGMLIFGCIPAGKNGMVERAYQEALSTGGGDVILNAVYEDSWAWTPIGNLYFVSLKGMAAKCAK
jgi:hypothetical protein